uniref:Uncharacterized protein n=1 Tax=viral metagenome TaxID=1070528 RepID=A0A6C0KJK0_9ZZZZ
MKPDAQYVWKILKSVNKYVKSMHVVTFLNGPD